MSNVAEYESQLKADQSLTRSILNKIPPETVALAKMRCFSSIKPELLRWLWPGRIPLGKFTLIAGDPGLGKSLLTIDIAARVSAGRKFPDGKDCHVGNAILLSAEDDPGDTIRPRLDAAEADVSKIHLLEAVRQITQDGNGVDVPFSLERDIPALDEAIKETSARFVIIDPISAYLGNVDSHTNAEVRGILSPLAALASRTEAAVIGVTHLRKSAGSAIYRAMGSLAFAAAARAVWGVVADRDDKERKLVIPIKQNLAPDSGGMAYRIEAQTPPGTPRIVWECGAITVDAESAMSGAEIEQDQAELQEAKEWLSDLLREGPQPASQVKTLSQQATLSWSTVRRAHDELGVESRKTGGKGAPWEWSLPDEAIKDAHTGSFKDAHPKTSDLSTFDHQTENKAHNSKEISKVPNIPGVSTFDEKSRFEEGEI